MQPIQLCLFSVSDTNEVVDLKLKVNELLTALTAIKSHCDAYESVGNPVDEVWLLDICRETIKSVNAI